MSDCQAPATACGEGSDLDEKPRPVKQKRQQVSVACSFCQMRKCKVRRSFLNCRTPSRLEAGPLIIPKCWQCDGQKPSCSTCLRKGVKCVYEIDGDLRRVDHLRRKNTALAEKCSGLEQLLDCLQSCNDLEAAALLQRVRSGENISDTVNIAVNGHCQSYLTDQRKMYTPPPTPSIVGNQCLSTEKPGSSSCKHNSPGGRIPGSVYKKKPKAHQKTCSSDALWGSYPRSTRKDSSSKHPIKTPEPDIKCEDSDSPNSQRLDLLIASPQSEHFGQSFYRDADGGQIDDPQHSEFEMSCETMALPEMERVTKSTSSDSIPYTDAWLELFGGHEIYKPSLVSLSGPQVTHSGVPHLMQPIWQPDDAPINRVVSDYLSAARQRIAEGTPVAAILAPEYINVQAFFQPRSTSEFPIVSEWASEINKGSVDVDVSVRLAHVLLQTYLMRWLIQPSMENYARMPVMIRPTEMQMLYPHMAAISTIPLPAVRDALIQIPPRKWTNSLGDLIGCTWPYPKAQCVEVNHSTGRKRLTTKFEAHVTDPANWSVDEKLIAAFPELMGKVNVRPPTPA